MKKNIVLIGMPGSGKSTVGRLLAQETGRDFFETDALVEEVEGRSIPEIFAGQGEAYFRDIESMVCYDVSLVEGGVIATGGGAVLREGNMAALGARGTLVFLDRDVEALLGLDHSGRPLLAGDPDQVRKTYTQRIELYRKYAQYTISGAGRPEETAEAVLDALRKDGLL